MKRLDCSACASIALAIAFCYALSAAPAAFAAQLATDRTSRIVATLRDATRCRGWQRFNAVKIDGTHTGGGLDGTFDTALDPKDGRSITRWYSGDLASADGYDGRQPWSTDYSKGTLVMNAPSAQATAVSQAWIEAHGWCDVGAKVRYRNLGTARVDGGRGTADVIAAVPRGGAPVTLFVDQASHLLDQTSLALDEDHEVASYADWRMVDDAAVPFQVRFAYPEDDESETEIVEDFIPRAAFGASTFAPPATVSGVTFPPGTSVVRVPYILDGIKPIVNVRINGRGPFPFVVDAGGHFILTAQTARAVGLRPRGAGHSMNQGNVYQAGYATVHRLRIGDVVIDDQVAKIVPYGFAKVERGPRPPKAGWLGRELFERFSVTLDPRTRLMTLRPLDRPRPVAPGTRVPIVFDDDSPLAPCQIDGRSGSCMLDTGNAGFNIIADAWARRTGLAKTFLRGIDDGGERVSRARIAIGPFERRAALVSCASPDMSRYEPYNVEAAILSEAVLDRFVMTFDYARDGVWLEPLPDIPQPFNRSGVLATKLPDGAFRVRRILAHSPATRADLRVGDRIVAVNGKPARQFSGADFVQANDAATATITFRIERGAQQHGASIRLRDLLPAR
jgi:hypothetical protein